MDRKKGIFWLILGFFMVFLMFSSPFFQALSFGWKVWKNPVIRHEKTVGELSTEEKAEFRSDLRQFSQVAERSWFVRWLGGRMVDPETQEAWQWAHMNLSEMEAVTSQILFASDRSWLVLLQNTDELRATGGFIGSYAEIQLDWDQLGEMTFHDIYDPDGLITQPLESPPGQKEYLSGGKGLRLPDANWSPDFPTSVSNIESLLAQAEKDSAGYEGVIAVNLTVIEKVLEVIGPVEVADFSEPLTAENLADLMRTERGEFFAGSREKTRALEQVKSALQVRFSRLTREEQQKVAVVIFESLENKDIQLFSPHPIVQNAFEKWKFAGQLEDDPTVKLPIYFVESNVGINKANRKVERDIRVDFLDLSQSDPFAKREFVVLGAKFTNTNTEEDRPTEVERAIQNYDLADHMGYINYQRIFLRPDDSVVSVTWQGERIEEWNERLVPTVAGDVWKEVGFLLKLPENSAGELQIIIRSARGLKTLEDVRLYPQAGVR
jgi:hypothetical protein